MSRYIQNVFYDAKQRRRKYFRALVITITVLFLASVFFVAAAAVQATRTATEAFNTAYYYNYYHHADHGKKIALTFDDGPDPNYTLKVAEILMQNDVPATFFFVGGSVLRHPEVVEEISDAGFTIGNHSFTHAPKAHDSPSRLRWELASTKMLIESVTGKPVVYYRPPFLLDVGIDPTTNPYLRDNKKLYWIEATGHIPIGADLDTKDWRARNAEDIQQELNTRLPDGHIMLMHDGGQFNIDITLSVLDEIIQDLKAEGYEFVSLDELLSPPEAVHIPVGLAYGVEDVDAGGDVHALQEFLVYQGHLPPENITGEFDASTAAALVHFQVSQGILPSKERYDPREAVVDEETARAIVSASQPLSAVMNARARDLSLQGGFTGLGNILRDQFIRLAAFSWPAFFVVVIGFLAFGVFRVIGLLVLLALTVRKERKKKREKRAEPTWKGSVSVVIPAYNEEENIGMTIRSVLEGEFKPKEVIVVDDGSTDGTAAEVEKLLPRYPSLKLVQVTNGGKAEALNIGFSMAKHEIVVTLDADSAFSKTTIKNLIRHFGDKRVAGVAGKVSVAHHRNFLAIFQSIEYIVGQNIEKRALSHINAVGVVPGPVGAWRRSVVLSCGGYSTDTLVEDQDLTLAALSKGWKIIYEPTAVAYTETPHTTRDFVKQRFRWMYGTIQCFWKYKGHAVRHPKTSLSTVVLPNIAVFNVIIPLFYPIVDLVAIVSIVFGIGGNIVLAYLVFTGIDMLYASFAFRNERGRQKLLWLIPFQRIYYRQIIYYVVLKCMIKAIEGTHALWNKVEKRGEMREFYYKVQGQGARVKN